MSGRSNIPTSYIIFKKDNKVLFVKRSHTGFMDGFYSLPAGHVEHLESFLATAVRETMEEVGVTVDANQLKHVHTLQRLAIEGNHVRVDVFFEAESWGGEPKNAEPHKHSDIAWLDVANLPENTVDYIKFALQQINQGNTYSEFGWGRK